MLANGLRLIRCRVIPFLTEQAYHSAFVLAFATKLFEKTEQHEFSRETFENVLEILLEPILNGLHLPREVQKTVPAGISPYIAPQFRLQGSQVKSLIEPEDLIGLHRILLDLNRSSDVERFTEVLQREAVVVHWNYFASLLIPYLRGAVQLLKGNGINMTSAVYQQIFRIVFYQYIERFVGTEPPHPKDWKKDRKGCRSCADCPKLDAFLSSPTQTVEEFKMVEKRRKHIEYRFPGYPRCIDFALTTQKNNSPFTLRITKILKDGELALREWQTRVQQARKTIASVATEHELRAILGDQYDAINNASMMKQPGASDQVRAAVPDSTTARMPMEPIHNPPPQAGHGATKRKASDTQENAAKRCRIVDIIDLT